MTGRWIGAALAALTALAAEPAAAQEAPTFPRVYQWETPQQGWLELTAWETVVPRSDVDDDRFGLASTRRGLWAQSIEVEYGFTDRLTVAAYADFEDPSGHDLAFTQARIEARSRLFDRYQRLLNPALYLEAHLPRGATGSPEELEARLILERDLGDFRIVANPALAKAWSTPEIAGGTLVELSAGAYDRRFWLAQPGVELFWSTGQLGHWPAFHAQYFLLGPSVDVNLTQELGFHVAAGFGVTDGTDDLMVRGYLTYQFQTVRPSNQQL